MNETLSTVDRLAELERMRFPDLALSAYLSTDAGAGHAHYRVRLQDLSRALEHKLDRRERAALRRELPLAVAALEKQRFDSPTVGVFVHAPDMAELWRLPLEVPDRLLVAPYLDLAPIRAQLFARPPAIAAVIDKNQARLYSVVLGEISEVATLEGVHINHHRQAGTSSPTLQRREDEHATWNLARVARVLAGLVASGPYRRLILAGPPEARARLKQHLPSRTLRLVAVEAAIPVHARGSEVVRRVRALDRS